MNPSPDRAEAIADIPSRLASFGVGLPFWWNAEPLKPSYFGKIKSELASEWLNAESALREGLIALEDTATLEDIENLDELEALIATL